jgi:hypothetical protein
MLLLCIRVVFFDSTKVIRFQDLPFYPICQLITCTILLNSAVSFVSHFLFSTVSITTFAAFISRAG